MLPIQSVIATTLTAIGAIVLSRLLVREWQRVNAELGAAAPHHPWNRGTADMPTLRRDPLTGEYRPG